MLKDLLAFFLLGFSSFLSLINPLATAPMFSMLTEQETPVQKRRISRKAALTTAITLIVFVFVGDLIFKFFGLTVHGFRIAGGILFFGIGYTMLQAKDSRTKTTEQEQAHATQKLDYAITPLGIPMLCGPGAISNAMILSHNAKDLTYRLVLIFTIILVAIITYIVLVGADAIIKFLGPTGLGVLKRLMGLIIMVIAVEFVVAGGRPILESILIQAIKQAS